jgi:hypothetical protein
VYDLLLSGALIPGITVHDDDDDRTQSQELTIALCGSDDSAPVPVTTPGGGFARLVGQVIRAAGVEAQRDEDASRFTAILPTAAAEWIADRSVLWTFLAGGWGIPQGAGGVEPPRRVDSGEVLTIATDIPTWIVRLECDRFSGDAALSWLVVETVQGGERAVSHPSRLVAAGVQRLRDLLGGNGRDATVTVRRQDPTAIPGGRGMMRLDSSAARVYWPRRSFRGVLTLLAGDTAGSPLHALQNLLDFELTGYGMLRLLQTTPRTAEERRSRPALRTVQELIRAEGAAGRSLADTAYRSGTAYQAAATLSGWLSPSQQGQLRRAFGTRRWEQIFDHGLRRSIGGAGGGATAGGVLSGAAGGVAGGVASRFPWNAVAAAAEVLIADLAQRAQRPGQRPPAAAVTLVRKFYLEPRGNRLRSVWEDQIRRGVLAELLEEVFLSQLKRDLPRLPRETLVLSAVGEPPAVKDRISAVFSRRGRAMFAEDVAVIQAAVERGEFTDWDRILAARSTVWGVYNRGGRHERGGTRRAGGSGSRQVG